ncbi:MAG: MFS transporter [Thermocladium sp.]|jgi:MFS family permease
MFDALRKWEPDEELAKKWQESLGTQGYRWVMVIIWLVMMTINSITLTNYPLALPEIAREFSIMSNTYTYFAGILSYSLGLFIIYFANFNGWMNTRIKLAVLLSQLFLMMPLFLIPIIKNYQLIVLLRFIEGLWFMELALATLNLRGWFSRNELAIAMAAPLSALQFGSALGGLLEKLVAEQIGWRSAFYITGIMDLAATILFFLLYRDPMGYKDFLTISKRRNLALRGTHGCPPPYKLPVAYTIGFAQIATTMAFASIPYLVPTYGYAARYSPTAVSTAVLIYGILSGLGIWGGALLGSAMVKRTRTAKETFRARNLTRTISYIISFVGFLVLVLFSNNYAFYVIGAVLAALVLFNIPNYWAEMTEVVPPGISGEFVFFAGAIASAGFFLGPLMSVYLIVSAANVRMGFILFIAVLVLSGIINVLQNKVQLPIDRYKA